MKRILFVLIFIISFVFSFQVNDAASQSPIVSGYYITGGEAWRPDSQMLIVPYIPTTHLIYKEQGVWKQKILVNGRSGKNYVWSHKGDQYVFWNDGTLYLASLTKKPVVIGVSDEILPAWSPDDRYIAYVCDNDIWINPIDSMKTKKVTRNPINVIIDLQWLNTGDEIIFEGPKINTDKRRYTIWKINTKTGETTMINNKIDCGYIITLYQDKVLFLDMNSKDFSLMDLNGEVIKITNDGKSQKHFVYYNNSHLFYTRNRTFFQLSEDNTLTTLLDGVDYVTMAPNGKTIAYSVSDKFYIVDDLIKLP